MVIDYAESWPGPVCQLVEQVLSAAGRVRVLLVARSSQADAQPATAAVHEILAAAPGNKPGPLDTPATGRAETYRAAALDLAAG